MGSRTLRRSSQNCIIAGVCGGIAEYFNTSPLLIRLLFIFSGIGIIPYILMIIFLNRD